THPRPGLAQEREPRDQDLHQGQGSSQHQARPQPRNRRHRRKQQQLARRLHRKPVRDLQSQTTAAPLDPPNEQPDAVDGQRQKSLLDKKPRPRRGFLSKSPQNTSLAKSFLDYFHPMKTILAFLLLFSTRLFAGQTDTILVHSAA